MSKQREMSLLTCSVLTTSTSFISWTGLKKCKPTNCFGRPDANAMSVIGKDEVFDAKTASGLAIDPIDRIHLVKMYITLRQRNISCKWT